MDDTIKIPNKQKNSTILIKTLFGFNNPFIKLNDDHYPALIKFIGDIRGFNDGNEMIISDNFNPKYIPHRLGKILIEEYDYSVNIDAAIDCIEDGGWLSETMIILFTYGIYKHISKDRLINIFVSHMNNDGFSLMCHAYADVGDISELFSYEILLESFNKNEFIDRQLLILLHKAGVDVDTILDKIKEQFVERYLLTNNVDNNVVAEYYSEDDQSDYEH